MEFKLPSDISTWDDKCMQAFIEENAAVFRTFALRYMDDADAVDDVLQEAYMRFWLRRAQIGEVASPRNYFFSVLKNIIADKRDYFSRSDAERVGEQGVDASDEGAFVSNMLEAETSRLIAHAIEQLSPQSRQVILMTLEEERMQDIADALGITVNTVKTVKYRALKRLSQLLSREDCHFLLLLCHL